MQARDTADNVSVMPEDSMRAKNSAEGSPDLVSASEWAFDSPPF